MNMTLKIENLKKPNNPIKDPLYGGIDNAA